MKLGIGLPTYLGNLVSAADMLEWARYADQAGFHALAVHDKPNHDTWEPLTTLAAVAAVTSRVRLATAALLLPTRDEALVAKQAAVVDQVSNGRLDLGLALGARPDDYELFGRPIAGRGRTFERQLRRIQELWDGAVTTRDTGSSSGPAPVQTPHPPLWIGGYTQAAVVRAIRSGDGYLFGAPGVQLMRERIPQIREAAAAAGRSGFPIAGLAYVLPSTDPDELADGERLLVRYYGTLRKPFPELVHSGPADKLIEALRRYEEAGLDVLHVIPASRTISSVDRLARDVLPAFT